MGQPFVKQLRTGKVKEMGREDAKNLLDLSMAKCNI